MIKLLNVLTDRSLATDFTTGTIVGWNIKKTLVDADYFMFNGSKDVPLTSSVGNEMYGLFVHIKVGNDQYTLIFDAFTLENMEAMSGYRSFVTSEENVSVTRGFGWKDVKRFINRSYALKESSKSFGNKAHKYQTYPINFDYEPALLKLMNIAGVSEAVDIIGSSITLEIIDTNKPMAELIELSDSSYVRMGIHGKDSNVIMYPLMYYIDTEDQKLQTFIDAYSKAHRQLVMPNYGHEVYE